MAQIITIDGGKKDYRIAKGGPHKGQKVWQVIDTTGTWYSLYWDGDMPKKGQQFSVNITSRKDDGGMVWRDAHIAGPTPEQFAQAENIHKLAQGIGNGPKPQPDKQSAPTVTASYADFKKAEAAAGPAKIKWADWAQMAEVVWKHGLETQMPPEQCIGYVQTTLVALRDGKLELPTDAGPVSDIQITNNIFEDSDAYANPDDVLPWGGGR